MRPHDQHSRSAAHSSAQQRIETVINAATVPVLALAILAVGVEAVSLSRDFLSSSSPLSSATPAASEMIIRAINVLATIVNIGMILVLRRLRRALQAL